ncbi:MAG: FAD-dependent oxidoreductase, partial [Fischerella sp.]|nr:FAD-dependent oxidoreductase [Fischerella sp.]
MQRNLQPIVKDLVMIGGGHSHAIALLMFSRKHLPGVRLTLITEKFDTPYSGMLPGHIAGFYSYDECHIDLRQSTNFAQAQLYIDRVVGLDLENQKVICANRPAVAFDVLSIDIGSTPATISVPGAAEYTIAVKPVSKLLEHWYLLLKNLAEKPQKSLKIAIVGGGAGGVELSLSMQARLYRVLNVAPPPFPLKSKALEIHLFQRDTELMPNYHRSVRRLVKQLLTDRGIQLHLGESVCKVESKHFTSSPSAQANRGEYKIICESGLTVECDRIFWVTQASAPQ